MKAETLDIILASSPRMLLGSVSHMLDGLATFIMKYTMCIRNKTKIKEDLKNAQRKAEPDDEQKNQFECALDFVEVHDVAFTWMEFKNHADNWTREIMNVEDPTKNKDKKKKPKSLWSGKMGGRKLGGSMLEDEGRVYYADVTDFIERLMDDEHYAVFQKICNAKARELGYIKDIEKMPDLPPATDGGTVVTNDEAVIKVPTFKRPTPRRVTPARQEAV
jgi:hypothetical protein